MINLQQQFCVVKFFVYILKIFCTFFAGFVSFDLSLKWVFQKCITYVLGSSSLKVAH